MFGNKSKYCNHLHHQYKIEDAGRIWSEKLFEKLFPPKICFVVLIVYSSVLLSLFVLFNLINLIDLIVKLVTRFTYDSPDPMEECLETDFGDISNSLSDL